MNLQRNNSTTIQRSSIKSEYRSEAIQCYLMIATQIIGFLVLTVYPILWTFKWSWYSYNGVPSQTLYVGWQNFITMFTTDITYWKVWGNTLLLAAVKIPIELTIALILALFLSKKMKGTNFFQSMFFLPNVISVVIIGLVFINMFSYWGIINSWLMKLGLITKEINWFASKPAAFAVLVMAGIWNTFGLNLMYFLAALTNVPAELYECAELDGASKPVVFFNVTIPMIAPVFRIILLLSIIGTLGANEFILVLTNGGPSGQTLTVMSYLTQQFVPGFTDSTTPALGYGCAMSLVTTVIFTAIALIFNKLSNKMNNIS